MLHGTPWVNAYSHCLSSIWNPSPLTGVPGAISNFPAPCGAPPARTSPFLGHYGLAENHVFWVTSDNPRDPSAVVG